MDSNITLDRGIYVAQIATDGPCYNSSLKVGDVIIKIDGKEVNKMVDLRNYIYTKSPSDVVTLGVIKGKKEQDIQIKLGKRI